MFRRLSSTAGVGNSEYDFSTVFTQTIVAGTTLSRTVPLLASFVGKNTSYSCKMHG